MLRWSRKMRRTEGFTLLESVMFILIGGVMIPSILAGLGFAARRSSDALCTYRNASIADSIMRQKMEALIGLSYSDEGLDVVSDRPLATGLEGFSGSYAIAYVDEDLEPTDEDVGYKKITASVSTPGGEQYALEAIVTRWSE
jgi:hypothetical protein